MCCILRPSTRSWIDRTGSNIDGYYSEVIGREACLCGALMTCHWRLDISGSIDLRNFDLNTSDHHTEASIPSAAQCTSLTTMALFDDIRLDQYLVDSRDDTASMLADLHTID